MKSSILLGVIFLVAGGLMFYFRMDTIMSQQVWGSVSCGLAGIGIGLVFGAIIGYASKSSAVRQKQKMEAIKEKAAKEALANAGKTQEPLP